MKLLQRWKQTTIANQVVSLSTVFMAVSTFFLAVAAGFQYFTMKEQTTAIKDQLRTAIAGQSPRFNIELAKAITLSPDDILRIDIKATNTGQTTALQASLSANMRHGYPPVPSDVHFQQPSQSSRVDLGPGMSTVLPLITRKFTPQEIEEFESGKRLMMVWVRLTYDDEFGGHNHLREWCLTYDHASKSIGFCP
jgi:hypothetical protein